MPDAFVRPPGAIAAGAIGFAHSPIARAPRTIAFALPHAAFAAAISACAGSHAARAKTSRTRAEATIAFAALRGSLAGIRARKIPSNTQCTRWHTLCFHPSRPAAGRETRWTFDIIAAEWRPTTARPKGGRSVV